MARKQGAQSVAVEDASDLERVVSEVEDLDNYHGGGGEAEAIAFSFFSEEYSSFDIQRVSDGSLIGHCIVINYRCPSDETFSKSYVFEAVFSTPKITNESKSLLNNYINVEGDFSVTILGREFRVTGVHYSQQNGITSVCAHACIRMVIGTLFPDRPRLTNKAISECSGWQPQDDGFTIAQIIDVMEGLAGLHVDVVNCQKISFPEYVTILTSAAESGDMALLVLGTGVSQQPSDHEVAPGGESENRSTVAQGISADLANHVVVVFGHTRNSDEWHPQAIPAYSELQSAAYCPSSSWVDHFVIHDDNFGPYFALNSRALEFDPIVRAKYILVIRHHACHLKAHTVEAAAAAVLADMLGEFSPINEEPWLEVATRPHHNVVMRPVLVTRDEYVTHIGNLVAHDETRAGSEDLLAFTGIPELFWMVEFTLADLLTGNHSKLGEVLIEARWAEDIEIDRRRPLIGLRLPNTLSLRTDDGSLSARPFPIASHAPIYMHRPHDHEW